MEIESQLPIYEKCNDIIRAIGANDVVIITGDTGCGKTTQVPKYILKSLFGNTGGKLIGVTQPRRISTIGVAERVAFELSTKPGDKVGYEIRFEAKLSERTQVKFMTEGILLKEFLQGNKVQEKYSHIIIDEAHERSINSDLLLGIIYMQLKKATRNRIKKDRKAPNGESVNKSYGPKYIIMSATLESDKLIKFYKGIEGLKIEVG